MGFAGREGVKRLKPFAPKMGRNGRESVVNFYFWTGRVSSGPVA